MSNILIATKPDDADAYYVKTALESLGHSAKIWFPSDMPTKQSHSFYYNETGVNWIANGLDFDVQADDEFDTVWLRRPRKPKVNEFVHPDDVRNANRELEFLYTSLWRMIAPNAFWVNTKEASVRTNCKLSQLKVAKKLGFNVPETLISTDPVAIKSFIQKFPEGEVIYKPLFPVMWVESDVMRLTYTKPIRLSDLPSNEILRLTPGIYQKRIRKAYELRVTCMGHSAFATKIYSQEHEDAKEDWRSVSAGQIKMEPYPFPPELAAKCFALMLKFGVVFGCFDFIVTPEGEYVFLEINEQGQFLWQEEQNSNITLLDPFVQFLTERKSNFVWKKSEKVINMPEFRESIIAQQKAAMATHVDPGLHI